MRSIIHYFKCLKSLTKKYLLFFLNSVVFGGKKAFAVTGAYLRVLKNASENNKNNYDLKRIYPDSGHLCNNLGFNFEECSYDLSIIVPVYNASKHINECLNSIVSQETRYTYEVIIIDDGSTDDTAEKINKYLTNDNVKLIKQQNSGQSAARNRAISDSKGKYLMFADSDDILLPGSINALMDGSEDVSDIVEGNYVWFTDTITQDMIKDATTRESIKSYRKSPRFVLITPGYSWAKIYRRNLWKTLRFPEGYIFEDVITKFILRRKANQVRFIGTPVYGYRRNPDSSSHGKNRLKKLDSIWVFPKIAELCRLENAPMDDIFYLLSLNHIGLLNYVTTRNHTYEIKAACFREMRAQLLSIQQSRPKKLPVMFKLLEKAILSGSMQQWEHVAYTITKYDMLKKWRERN